MKLLTTGGLSLRCCCSPEMHVYSESILLRIHAHANHADLTPQIQQLHLGTAHLFCHPCVLLQLEVFGVTGQMLQHPAL